MATGRTWAQVARKKTPPALPTECAVNLKQYAALLRLPPSSSRHSAFIPLLFNFTNNWMLDTLASLPNSAVSIVPRQDISLIEVCFANKEAQQDFLSSTYTPTHFTVQPLPPAGTPPQYVPIKLVNVPILSTLVLDHQIRSLWSKHGEIVALAPHLVKGLPLSTNRWDMVLKLPAVGNTLTATPFFDILGFKVLASWPGLDKACPHCKAVGHDSRACPRQPASTKRSNTKPTKKSSTISSTPLPTPLTLSLAADAAPRGSSSITQASMSDAAAVVAPTSDPDISESTDMDIMDEDMADISTSASTSTPISAPTISSAGPQRMAPMDILRLSPSQLSSLSPSVAPKSISMDLYLQLSPEQMDVIPDFILVKDSPSKKPVALPLR